MNIELTHPFIYKSHGLSDLLAGTNKLSTFCSKLKKQSKLFPDRYDSNKYCGDGFELFAEFLIKVSPVDNRIGISNYQLDFDKDIGVDGYGIGSNGKPATVQVKFRDNSNYVLTANVDHLSNFTSGSHHHYKVDAEDQMNMLVITSAKGLHYYTENEMYINKVRCLGYQELRTLVDNNLSFWNLFRGSLNV